MLKAYLIFKKKSVPGANKSGFWNGYCVAKNLYIYINTLWFCHIQWKKKKKKKKKKAIKKSKTWGG